MRHFYCTQFFIFITPSQIDNYNWSIFNRAHYFLIKSPQRLRSMSRQRINFFESPNPLHFNLQHIRGYQHPLSQDHDMHQDVLLVAQRPRDTPAHTPIAPLDSAINQRSGGNQMIPSDEYFEQNSQHPDQMEQQHESCNAIRDRIDFNEQEDVLLPMTPIKLPKNKQHQNETTRRQAYVQNTTYQNVTPGTQSRSNQRGLKKLAAQAYRFVLHQKRASYKQVAKKLIEEVSEDSLLMDGNKRGEMNIKRRVYDALNVLIALGLLRRNGNKIMSKKEELQFLTEDHSHARQRQRRRQIAMKEELDNLKEIYQRKQDLIKQKEKLQLEMREKVDCLKGILDKNRNSHQQLPLTDNKFQFPLIVLCCNQDNQQTFHTKRENTQSKYSMSMQDEKQQESLKLWQNDPQKLNCSFNRNKNVTLLGEIDVLGLYTTAQKKEKPAKVQRVKRRR